MLQQTQVRTVLPYFVRFCARFPDVRALAAAPLGDVLALWSGLGYYARARHLHACAHAIVERFGGDFPVDALTLAQLPGIGRSTAAAIAAFCANARVAILDGNVKRVLARHCAIEGDPGLPSVQRRLWTKADALLPPSADMPAYTQGLMDLGATVCTRRTPKCADCPVQASCAALANGRVHQLPTPRPRKASPRRRAWALLALHDGRVLLQQLAPAGIWGGLLALPQFGSAVALRQAASAIDATATLQLLPARRHSFTHFTLTLLPRRLDVRSPAPVLAEPRYLWLALRDIETAALPSPVRAILREVVIPPAQKGRAAIRAYSGAPSRRPRQGHETSAKTP
jgi:A/G-specific adenine glycosylase